MSSATWSGVIHALLALAGCQSIMGPPSSPDVPMATPPGVTLRETRGHRDAANINVPGPIAYADAQGKLAYIHAGDTTPGKSACTDACAESWPPLLAVADAKAAGDWSLIVRDGGAKQWSFKGNPLYTAKVATESAAYKTCTVARRNDGASESSTAPQTASQESALPEEWCVARFEPGNEMLLPDGIAVEDVPSANGPALVESNGLTLYAFNGDAKRDGLNCLANPRNTAWIPLAAPELAMPMGEFSVVNRADTTRQWAYRGRPLYTFSGDVASGDANGVGADARWEVAAIARYFTPQGVEIHNAPGFGTIWATVSGITLYNQNRGGERRRNPARTPASTVTTCDAKCLEAWHPFIATGDAVPSSFWTVVTLTDGAKQWAYRGKPVFTYAGDHKVGDMRGKFLYNYLVRDSDGQVVKVTVGFEPGEGPVYWRPVFPY